MQQGTVSMRKIKEIARLYASGLKQKQIALGLNLSVGAVNKYIKLLKAAQVTWPLEMEESDLHDLLFKHTKREKSDTYSLPDYVWIHQELYHKGVTLQLLHQEYKQQHPKHAYEYTQFCSLYRRWKKQQKLSFRHEYNAGEIVFIDYAGPTMPIHDPKTHTSHNVAIFVAVLGASHYTYAEATWDQTLPHFIASHTRAFTFFGGVPTLVVPDNLKSGVRRACWYDPDVNPTYTEMSAHYNTAILPARPYKPKDKARVEKGVQMVERQILARLRHQVFYTLDALNKAIGELLHEMNHKPFQKKEGSRAQVFHTVEKPALKPLPVRPYEYACFKTCQVGIDYHIAFENHYYSVPYSLVREKVECRITAHMIEIFHQGKRIASHAREKGEGTSTLLIHMPASHQKHYKWSPDSCMKWASHIGEATQAVMRHFFEEKKHVRQVYRLFLGMVKLTKRFGEKRLEAACHRALFYHNYTYRSLCSTLEKGLDRLPLPAQSSCASLPPVPCEHENIRGAQYYQ